MPHHLLRPERLRRPRLTGVAAALLVGVGLGATLALAAVHTRLESSFPAANQVLSTAPQRFELRFSGPVDDALSALVLVTPSGDSIRVNLETPGDDDQLLVGEVPPLNAGDYVVLWRTVSADGHPVSGEFGFSFVAAPVAAAETSESAEATDETAAASAEIEPATVGSDPVPSEARPAAGIVALAGLGLICLLGFAGLLWYCGSLPLLQEPRIQHATVVLGWSALLLLSTHFLFWTLSVLPPGSGLAGMAAALGSTTGLAGLARLGLISIAVFTLPRAGRAAAAFALAAVVVGAASGHAAAISPWVTIPAKAIHLGAAAVWFGGLLTLVLAPDGPTDGTDAWRFGSLAQAVSSAALLSVVLIAASGMVQSAWFVGDFAAYAGTPYGRGVLAKWAGLFVLVGFGAVHRRRTLPALDRDGSAGGLRRTVRLETIVMLAVVMLAAWLARVSPPAGH
jgi:copper transport protein